MDNRPQSAVSLGRKSKKSVGGRTIASGGMASTMNVFMYQSSIKRKVNDLLKLLAVMAPLTLALILLASLSMYQALHEMTRSKVMIDSLRNGEAVRLVVDSLQRERDMTCLFMAAQGQDDISKSLLNVLEFRAETDVACTKVDGWIGDERFPSKEYFNIEINKFRGKLALEIKSCSPVLDYYSDLIDYLLNKMLNEFNKSKDGEFWMTLNGYYILLKVKDLIGLKRATGVAILSSAIRDPIKLEKFIGLKKTAAYLFKTVEMILPIVHEDLRVMYLDYAQLINGLAFMEDDILHANSSGHNEDAENSHAWFLNMTEYLTLYTHIENDVHEQLVAAQKSVSEEVKFNFNLVLGIVIGMAVVCPSSLAVYSLNYQKLMDKIKKLTRKIQSKQHELARENQKTELLLHQLLPKPIAKQILLGRTVAPEHFESVTVFFSDIQGFTSLSASSTPFQITEVLNQLYSNCDAMLESYDCYKVETIGDAYLVSCGVPNRNTNHSEQICTMSLDLLRMMSQFPIPHRPWEKLLMRIGVHTGSLTAGVVGLKMPRYCLFGDTVSIGARMESTGFSNRIQISQQCKENLDERVPDRFHIQYRNTVNVKGKGEMYTFWILGKLGFNFSIDLEETQQIVDNTEYWKLGKNGLK